MQSENHPPTRATRLRLSSLGPLAVDPALTCFYVSPEQRSPVAATIARSVIGPRPSDIEGTVEIAGRLVSIQSLPAPLLRPSATATIDRAYLDSVWHAACGQQRADLEAAHAARRLDRHRTEAAIERARRRAEAAVVVAPTPAPAPEPEPVPEPVVDDVTPDLERRLAALTNLQPVPAPAAQSLADEFDALAAETPPPPPVDIDLTAHERRIAAARVDVAHAAGGVLPEARTRIEGAHRVVVDTEREMYDAGRKEKSAAMSAYQAALSELNAALHEAGVESYASYLVAIAAGAAPIDVEGRLRAELELADAEDAMRTAQATLESRVADDRDERLLELRARAAQMLGHFPSDDAATELRALRVPHPDAATARDELRAALAALGVEGDDVEQLARDTVDARKNTPPPQPPAPPEPVAPVAVVPAEDPALRAEIDALIRERARHEEVLAALESELEHFDRQGPLSFGSLMPDAAALAVNTLIDRYRSSELLAGRLPVVIDGALDDLDAPVAARVALQLSDLDDVQVIVVTSDDALAKTIAGVGAPVLAWPGELATSVPLVPLAPPLAPAPALAPPPAPEPAGAHGVSCSSHTELSSAATCVHCRRPSCLDCLVYVPGEPELWCVDCAETLRNRNLRLLRRRGA